jgi:DNA-binding MarR family transcriptional regulator
VFSSRPEIPTAHEEPNLANEEAVHDLVVGLRNTSVSLVRRDGPDLTTRQLAVFLICYLDDDPHTIRGVAARLDVPKPAISRAGGALDNAELVERRDDPAGKRSVVLRRTAAGRAFLRELRSITGRAFRPIVGPSGRGWATTCWEQAVSHRRKRRRHVYDAVSRAPA